MLTVTFGATAPEASVTRPVMVDVPICARAATEAAHNVTRNFVIGNTPMGGTVSHWSAQEKPRGARGCLEAGSRSLMVAARFRQRVPSRAATVRERFRGVC